ncbi:hypothetical protein D3C73_1455490 [compost metagenome]
MGTGIHQVVLERLVAGHGLAIDQPGRNQQPAAMTDDRDGLAGRGAHLDQVLGILVDADGVGILHAARQDHGVVFFDAGRAEGPVNLEVVRRFIVVPAFDLTFLR